MKNSVKLKNDLSTLKEKADNNPNFDESFDIETLTATIDGVGAVLDIDVEIYQLSNDTGNTKGFQLPAKATVPIGKEWKIIADSTNNSVLFTDAVNDTINSNTKDIEINAGFVYTIICMTTGSYVVIEESLATGITI